MSCDYNKIMLDYVDSMKETGEELLLIKIPQKIEFLNNLIAKSEVTNKNLEDIHGEIIVNTTSRKRRQGSDRIVQRNSTVNQSIAELTDMVKPHIRNLVEDCNLLKMWILHKMPKAEMGNNFGVSVQEMALSKTQQIEQETASFYDQINKYYAARGKMISKIYKAPHLQDYRCALRELDDVQYLSLCLILIEVRNRYCYVHDFLVKNLEKIRCPRSGTANESLY